MNDYNEYKRLKAKYKTLKKRVGGGRSEQMAFVGDHTHYDKILIVPCLNEVKAATKFIGISMAFFEKEQEPGYYTTADFENIYLNKKSPCSSKEVYYNGKPDNLLKCSKPQDRIPVLEYNDSPDSPKNDNYYHNLIKNSSCSEKTSLWVGCRNCHQINRSEILKNLVKMVNKKRKQKSGLENIAIIATHHNVLKKLFPLNKSSSGPKYGYANCCCLKVKWEKEGDNLTVTCYFQGFPEETSGAATDPEADPNDDQPGKTKYNYINKTNETDNYYNNYADSKKGNNLKSNGEIFQDLKKDTTLLFIRHGNALHNGPIKFKSYDSCLTTLGIAQAEKLGEFLKSELVSTSNYYLPMASYLFRTQQTCVTILDKLLEGSTKPLDTNLSKFLEFSKSETNDREDKAKISLTNDYRVGKQKTTDRFVDLDTDITNVRNKSNR